MINRSRLTRRLGLEKKRLASDKVFTITVSSLSSLRSYRLTQATLKKVVIFIPLVFLALFITTYMSVQLSVRADKVQAQRIATQQHQKLTQSHQSLNDQYQELNDEFLQSRIEVDYLKHLLDLEKRQLLRFESKLSNFENKIKLRVTLVEKSSENVDSRLQSVSQSIEERKIALSIIPNGYPFKVVPSISSDFGWRIHPIKKVKHMHNGADYITDTNTPIHATANGIVEFAGYQKGYGKTIIINHDLGFKTLFAHLSSIKVSKNDFVKKNQVIALSGNTGVSTGPHLHYGIQFLKKFLNPRDFVSWNLYNYDLIFKKKNSQVPWKSLKYSIQERVKQYRRLYSPLLVTSEETSE